MPINQRLLWPLCEQLFVVVVLSLLAQYRYLQYRSEVMRQARESIQEKYRTYRERVLSVDEKLLQLKSEAISRPMERWSGHAPPSMRRRVKVNMVSIERLVLATQLSINVSRPCGGNLGKDLTLVVLVFNRAQDYFRRKAIRETYGAALKGNPSTAIYFVLAKGLHPQIQARLEQEAAIFNDIIQVDYQEDYYNCTMKAVALVRWVALHCPFCKFALKLDDDSFVRVKPLLAQLHRLQSAQIMGNLNSLNEVDRHNASKWFISQWAYPKLFYPPYISGVYLVPCRLTVPLYEAIVAEPVQLTIPALPFEDAYITGIVAAKARIPRAYFESQLMLQQQHKNDTKLLSQYSILYNSLCPIEIAQLWQLFGPN